jgi:hypothetical protein
MRVTRSNSSPGVVQQSEVAAVDLVVLLVSPRLVVGHPRDSRIAADHLVVDRHDHQQIGSHVRRREVRRERNCRERRRFRASGAAVGRVPMS